MPAKKSHEPKVVSSNKDMDLIKSGRQKVLYVIIALFVFQVISQIAGAAAGTHNSSDVVRLIFTILLLYFLYQGHNWARWLTVFFNGLAALAVLGFLLIAPAPMILVIMGTMLALFIAVIYILTALPDVKAFFKQPSQK
jgi:hypothetical protein